MSIVSKESFLSEINRARTKPLEYAELVQKQIDSFVDDWKMPLYPGCFYKTNEGKQVWIETFNFLKKQKPLHEYKLNGGLTLASDDHVADLAAHDMFGHDSSNGDDLTTRIKYRCGKDFVGTWGECVGSSFDVKGVNHATATVLGLIIDDGVPNRGHRNAKFSSDYNFIGSSSRKSGSKVITVIDFHSKDLKTVRVGEKNV